MTQKLGPSTYTTKLCNPYCRLVMQMVERLAEGKSGGNPIRYIKFGFIFEITVTQLLNQNYKGYLVIWIFVFVGWDEKQKYPLGFSNRQAYESLRQKEVLGYSFFCLTLCVWDLNT